MLFAIAIDEKLNFKKYVSIISKKEKNHLNPVCRIANVYIKKKSNVKKYIICSNLNYFLLIWNISN